MDMTTTELEEMAMRDLAHIGAGMATGLGPACAVAMLVLTACGITDPNYVRRALDIVEHPANRKCERSPL
jgi:hypothetical protein